MTKDSVVPVTAEAVAAIFKEEDLQHRVDGQMVRSGFVNTALVVAIDGPTLVFEAVWRGAFPQEMASHLLFAVNEHNQTHFAPTLRMFESEDGTLAASAIRTMNIAEGASFNQLGAFIVNSIDATLQTFDFLETSFPTLVTWEDPHDDH
ncbi:YbjN domain-containing protein [Corynebacterium sp. TA-R-1]|uniref:YbjN domain-containing protein n=1 Tax=Corynebacterium stercoris TaxID=2943490 RepID=A0ABT1FZF3_9CORY|nr:YbjN domain-containing protein [Corynebacterium stercoris]